MSIGPTFTLEQHEEALAFLRPSQLWIRAGEMRGLRGKQGRGLSLPAMTGPVAWADAWSQARPHRLSWAALHARVFDIGISVVPHAEGACASSQRSPRRPLYAATSKASACQATSDRTSATPAATKPRLRRMKNPNSNAIGHRRQDGDLRSQIWGPTL